MGSRSQASGSIWVTEQQQVVLLTDLIAAEGRPFEPLYLQDMGDDAEVDDGEAEDTV